MSGMRSPDSGEVLKYFFRMYLVRIFSKVLIYVGKRQVSTS